MLNPKLSKNVCLENILSILQQILGSVSIATRYGLDGPGIESRLEARFSASV